MLVCVSQAESVDDAAKQRWTEQQPPPVGLASTGAAQVTLQSKGSVGETGLVQGDVEESLLSQTSPETL